MEYRYNSGLSWSETKYQASIVSYTRDIICKYNGAQLAKRVWELYQTSSQISSGGFFPKQKIKLIHIPGFELRLSFILLWALKLKPNAWSYSTHENQIQQVSVS